MGTASLAGVELGHSEDITELLKTVHADLPRRITRTWKRRRRRKDWFVLWLVVLFLPVLAFAQGTTTAVTNPSFSHFNLTSSSTANFHLDPPNKLTTTTKVTYSVTLNLCTLPANVPASQLVALGSTPILFVSSSSSLTTPSHSTPPSGTNTISNGLGGFANVTIVVTRTSDEGIWIGVTAPENPANGVWSFELGVSTSGPLHIIDQIPLFQFADSDANNALLVSPTYFQTLTGQPNQQALVVATNQQIVPPSLAWSSCFLRNSSALLPASSITTSATTRGVVTLGANEGGTGQSLTEARAGGQRTQYLLSNLTHNVNYTVWGLEMMPQQASGGNGMRLYQPQWFRTKNGDNCRLVNSFSTCPEVAYAIPAPTSLPTPDLLAIYEAQLTPYFTAFNTTLSTFPCGSTKFGMYSFVRTCEDCMTAYTNWLCSVIVPRCDDVPNTQANAAQAAFQAAVAAEANNSAASSGQTVFAYNPPPASIQTLLIRSDPLTSRTPFLGPTYLANLTATNATFAALNITAASSPFPYAEPPPCSSVCNLVAASCPSVIGWNCPLAAKTLSASYGQLRPLSILEVQGGDEGPQGGGWPRGTDRFGNVFCNALDTDVLLAKRSSGPRLPSGKTAMGWTVTSFMIFWTLCF